MGVTAGSGAVGMAEQSADDRQAVAGRHADAGEAVPQIVEAQALEEAGGSNLSGCTISQSDPDIQGDSGISINWASTAPIWLNGRQ